jgi:hypothetical protein
MLAAVADSPSGTADFENASTYVQSEVIRAAALQLLSQVPPDVEEVGDREEVEGGVNLVTLEHLQALLLKLDGQTPLSVGAVVALGEVCSRFTPGQIKAVEDTWREKDQASYEAWLAIAELGRRAATAETGLQRQKAAVRELRQFLVEHVGATGKQQAELEEVRRELRQLVAAGASDDAGEACARTVLEVLDPDAAKAGPGGDTCLKARDAAAQTIRRLRGLETEMETLRAVEPKLGADAHTLAKRTRELELEAARIQDAQAALMAKEAAAERVLAESVAAQRALLESEAGANTVLETREAGLGAEARRLQAEMDAREAQVREAMRAVAAREAALRGEGVEAQEAIALREEQARGAAVVREAQAQKALEAVAASEQQAREAAAARAQDLEARAHTSEVRVAEMERDLAAKAAAAAALGEEVRAATAVLAAKEAQVAQATEAAAAKHRQAQDAEADISRREEQLRLRAETVGNHVGQLSVAAQAVEAKNAELDRALQECTAARAALQTELQECAAATGAQMRARDEAREQAAGQSVAFDKELAAARQELAEAKAAEARTGQAVQAEVQAQIEGAKKRLQQELEEQTWAHAESERRLTRELEEVRQAQQAALRAHQQELEACEGGTRARQHALALSESRVAECADQRRQLELRASTDAGCVSALRTVLRTGTVDDTCSVTRATEEHIRRLQQARDDAERERDAARVAASVATEAAATSAVNAAAEAAAKAGEASKNLSLAVTEAASSAAAAAKAEAEVSAKTAADAAARVAAEALARAVTEERAARDSDVKRAAEETRAAHVEAMARAAREAQAAAEAAAKLAGKVQQAACVAQVSELQEQLRLQTDAAATFKAEAAATEGKRASGLEEREAEHSRKLAALTKEKRRLASRVAELEAQTTQVGAALGCVATSDGAAACDILKLLGTTLSKRDDGNAAHAAEFERLESTHAVELERLGAERKRTSAEHASVLAQAAADHEASVQVAAAEHEASVKAAAAEHEASVQTAAAQHAAELGRTKEAHVDAMREKSQEVAGMYLKVYAAEDAVTAGTKARAALQAQLAEQAKELAGAREQLEATGRLRLAAHGQRKEVDRCVAELRALLLPTGHGPGAPTAESVDVGSPGDVCAAVRGAVAEIARLRPTEQELVAAGQRAQRAEQATRTLHAALGCGAAERDVEKCAARATGILELLRPPGTAVAAVVDPVARARELAGLEVVVKQILRDVPMADRDPLHARLQAWAGTQAASLRSQLIEQIAKANKFVHDAAVALDLQGQVQGQVLPATVLDRLKGRAVERKALVGALQTLAKLAGYVGSVPATTNALVDDTTVKKVVELASAHMARGKSLGHVAVLAARACGLIDSNTVTMDWVVQGYGDTTCIALKANLATTVTLKQIAEKLQLMVFVKPAPVRQDGR